VGGVAARAATRWRGGGATRGGPVEELVGRVDEAGEEGLVGGWVEGNSGDTLVVLSPSVSRARGFLECLR
jgi:hypothetical protein